MKMIQVIVKCMPHGLYRIHKILLSKFFFWDAYCKFVTTGASIDAPFPTLCFKKICFHFKDFVSFFKAKEIVDQFKIFDIGTDQQPLFIRIFI